MLSFKNFIIGVAALALGGVGVYSQTLTMPVNGQVASGGSCAYALRSDGLIYSWGGNGYGELGNGTRVASKTPVVVKYSNAGTLTNLGANCQIATDAVGWGINATLRTDGSVWVWGDLGGEGSVTYARKIETSGIKYIATGGDVLVMIRTDGTMFRRFLERDYNGSGVLVASFSPADNIVAMENGVAAKFTQVSIYKTNIIALDENKKIWTAGLNSRGSIGNGTTIPRYSLEKVPLLSGVNFNKVSITKFTEGTCHAVSESGLLYAWGSGWGIGDGTIIDQLEPVVVAGTGYVVDVYADEMILKCSDGSVKTWFNSANIPMPATAMMQQIQRNGSAMLEGISGDMVSNSLGEVWMFGVGFGNTVVDDDFFTTYDLGRGDSVINEYKTSPVALADTKQTKVLAAGFLQRENGRLMVWGDARKYIGQTGPGISYGQVTNNAPVPFYDNALMRDASKIVTGSDHVLILSRGMVFAFGANTAGQLGNGTTSPSSGVVVSALGSDVIDIAVGYGESWALKSDGTVWYWGGNTTLKPKKLILNYLVSDIEASLCIEKLNGKVHQVTPIDRFNFDGTVTNEYDVMPVLTNIQKIATNGSAHFALTASGTVYSWGWGYDGELGLGSVYERTYPTTVISGLTSVADIKVDGPAVIVLLTNKTVRTWGDNRWGQIGDGTLANRSTPYTVPGLTNVTAIATGFTNNYALKTDGTVVGWGLGGANLGYNPDLASLIPIKLKADSGDSDRDGIPNSWEAAHAVTGATVDDDADGLNNIQEYVKRTYPKIADTDGDVVNDFADSMTGGLYVPNRKELSDIHANSYDMFILGGDNQIALVGSVNRDPFDVALWNMANFTPHEGIPISYSIISQSGALDTAQNGTFSANSVSLVTDEDGTAIAYFKQPAQSGVVSSVKFRAGVEEYIFVTASVAPVPFVPGSNNSPMTLDQSGFNDQDTDNLNDVAETAGWPASASAPVQMTTNPADMGYQLFTP